MSRLRHALLIALTLLVAGPIYAQADTVIVAVEPTVTSPRTLPPRESSDSGDPDIGQGKVNHKDSINPGVVPAMAGALRWVRVVWSTRYLGIGL